MVPIGVARCSLHTPLVAARCDSKVARPPEGAKEAWIASDVALQVVQNSQSRNLAMPCRFKCLSRADRWLARLRSRNRNTRIIGQQVRLAR
jgi:hypothetical protein